jgi:hypothetical protein
MGTNRWALYWCETEDHDEDWFVVARTAREARRFFEEYEDYCPGHAEASRICAVPEAVVIAEPCWALPDVLTQCGAKILRAEEPRLVEIRGIRYEEGRLEALIMKAHDDAFQARGQGRPNGTSRPDWN